VQAPEEQQHVRHHEELQGREGRGVVPTGSEAESLKRRIADKLIELRDPATGDRVVERVYTAEETFSGPFAHEGPDMVVGFRPGYRASWQSAVGVVPHELVEDNTESWAGDHLIDPSFVPGILFTSVPVERDAPSVLDIAPTVLGFYLLVALGPHGPIGGLMQSLGGRPPAFTFTGLVIGSVFYSLPFVVQPLQGAFTAIGRRPLEVAATLRASPLDRFFTVAVPLARPGFLTAAVLGFAHTLGEFGVVLMIGGNIPGETQVISIAIYDHVESLEYTQAHWISAGLFLLSFLMLMTVYGLNRRFSVVRP